MNCNNPSLKAVVRTYCERKGIFSHVVEDLLVLYTQQKMNEDQLNITDITDQVLDKSISNLVVDIIKG